MWLEVVEEGWRHVVSFERRNDKGTASSCTANEPSGIDTISSSVVSSQKPNRAEHVQHLK